MKEVIVMIKEIINKIINKFKEDPIEFIIIMFFYETIAFMLLASFICIICMFM